MKPCLLLLALLATGLHAQDSTLYLTVYLDTTTAMIWADPRATSAPTCMLPINTTIST